MNLNQGLITILINLINISPSTFLVDMQNGMHNKY